MKRLLAAGALLTALVALTPEVAPAAAPPDHYANHPIKVRPNVSSTPTGLSPASIRQAYGYSNDPNAGAGKTIAIVDAYDNPNAEADLTKFSSQFGLPSCTSASGCFKKVDQAGGKRYPRFDGGWALEIALDIQWAHAMAPKANILLVEATTNSFTNLLAAEDYATSHADYISNSWGAPEFSGETTYDSHFNRPGKSIFVSAGDNGLPAEYPSSSPHVISVGGTRLTKVGTTTTWTEAAWTDGGGGCSLYETALPAQSNFSGYAGVACAGKRATPDVSLNADPASGVAVYMSAKYQGRPGGWYAVGGTSASAPMWAGLSAAAGITVDAARVYDESAANPIRFRDIVSGNNGAPALTGFDLATGRGSWIGPNVTG
jgi:subtilase family serine protease